MRMLTWPVRIAALTVPTRLNTAIMYASTLPQAVLRAVRGARVRAQGRVRTRPPPQGALRRAAHGRSARSRTHQQQQRSARSRTHQQQQRSARARTSSNNGLLARARTTCTRPLPNDDDLSPPLQDGGTKLYAQTRTVQAHPNPPKDGRFWARRAHTHAARARAHAHPHRASVLAQQVAHTRT